MAIINKGTSFSNGEQLTADKLNDLVDLATFNQGATDSNTTDINSLGQIVVNQGGIATDNIATGAVTKSRMENVANMKALGNTSGSAAAPQEVSILDEDTMSSDSATSLATQQSIKAYVDTTAGPTVGFTPTSYTGGESVTFPNGLIMKWGIVSHSSSGGTITFAEAFPNAVINIQGAAVGADTTANLGVTSFNKTQIVCNPSVTSVYHWQAVGH